MRQRSSILRILVAGLLLLLFSGLLPAQATFRKPLRRSQNLLEIRGPCLKTIYTFKPAYYDTVQQQGPEPLLVAKYRDEDLVPFLFDAVFSRRIRVYDPNFWGSVPQLIEKTRFEEFDTLEILNYLAAGWDTSLMIDNNGRVEEFPEYREIPYEEISGIFFFESWWLDRKDYRMYKDIAAYLPIREYLTSVYDEHENTEVRRRLLFMVIPEWSSGSEKPVKYRPKDFRLLREDIRYEVRLYNKPYEQYLYREEEYGQISQEEFNEWQYHHFDFHRFFDANTFLENIIIGILEGKLKACPPGEPGSLMDRTEFIGVLRNYPGSENAQPFSPEADLLPENYPLSELNSIVFHEDWYIHPGNLQIYKGIRSITVNRHEIRVDNYTGEFIKGSVVPLFTVWF